MPPAVHRALLPLAAALLLASCFEPAIRETLYLDFAPNGFLRITAEVELAAIEAETNPAVKRRLSEIEGALLEGTDPWSARFAALPPAAERFGWEKRLGRLRSVRRAAMVTEPEALQRFFGSTDVSASYRIDAEQGLAELTLAPGSSSRAGRRERRLVEEVLGRWSETLAVYLREVAALYAYLDEHPERDRACLGKIYEDLLSEEEKRSLPALFGTEEEQLDRLGDAMLRVWDVLQVPSGEEMSIDELSRLVLDPFPARLEIALPSAPTEVEGFADLGDGRLEVPEISLWAAFRRLADRWVSPSPAVVFIELRWQAGEQPVALTTLLAPKRVWATSVGLPDADEIRQAIVAALTPAALYRAVWSVRAEEEPPLEWRE